MAFYIRRQLPGGEEGKPEYVHVGDGPALVTFGSDATNDIRVDVTDPNERVNSRHCTLVYTGAGFRIDFERDTRVFIGDSPTPVFGLSDPFHDSGDKKAIKLRLGMPVAGATGEGARSSRNPVFHIYRDDAGIADLRRTKPGKQESYDPIERVKRNSQAIVKLAAFSAGLFLVAGAMGYFLYSLATTVDRRANWTRDMEAALSPSVGVIGVARMEGGKEASFEPTGTGWLCCAPDPGQPDRGWFIITNGHVWTASNDAVKKAVNGAKIVIHFPEQEKSAALPDRQIDLQPMGAATTITPHPLYGKFGAFLTGNQLNDAAPNVYDVIAIPITGTPKALEGRTRFALAPPRGGPHSTEPVAAIGYPVENLPYAVNYDSPVPKLYTSNIVRRTSPFLGPAARGVPSLLALPAESAGGLSGSPVVAGEKDNFHVVGLVMQASLTTPKRVEPATPLPGSPPGSPPTASPPPAAATGETGRFATSNMVFATDSETVRELFVPEAQQRLTITEAEDAWKLSHRNQFREPLAASFEALTAMPGCSAVTRDEPGIAGLSDAMARDPRAGSGSPGLSSLKRMGGYSRTEAFAAGELLWVAAAYEKPSDAPLELEIRETGSGSAEKDADAFMVVPGFSSYLWTGAPRPGSLDIAVRGERGARVKIYVQRCPSPKTQAGVSANGQR